MTKAELKRQLNAAEEVQNYFDRLNAKVEVLAQYLIELPQPGGRQR